jgi:hypothetical protein
MEMEVAADSDMGAWASRLTRELIRVQLEKTEEEKTELLSSVVHKGLEELFIDVPESPEARVAMERTAHLLSTFSLVAGSLIHLYAAEMHLEPQQLVQGLATVMQSQGHAF